MSALAVFFFIRELFPRQASAGELLALGVWHLIVFGWCERKRL